MKLENDSPEKPFQFCTHMVKQKIVHVYIQQEHTFIITSPQVCLCVSVCVSVCLSVCPWGYLWNHTRDLYQIFVHVAYVRGSVLHRHVDDRPHRLPAGRGWRECTTRAKCNLQLPCFTANTKYASVDIYQIRLPSWPSHCPRSIYGTIFATHYHLWEEAGYKMSFSLSVSQQDF